jgi:hypothetical protein
MSPSAVNSLLNEALDAWIALTGVQTGPDFRGNLRDLDLRSATREVAESREYDPSGITTCMLLRALAERRAREQVFTALDLLDDQAGVAAILAPLRTLRDLLTRPEVLAIVETFRAQIRDAAVSYGVADLSAVETLLAAPDELGLVRRDAMRSIVTLYVHQFAHGDAAAVPLRLNPDIYQFWSVASLLWALRGQSEPGITMALIRDSANPLRSFFVFGVRNGGTITLLTDRAKDPHPGYANMSRRPDHALDKRAERHRFPYELLDLERGEDDRLRASATTALVSPETKGVPLKRIVDLTPDALVWTILMVDLIRGAYGVENRQLPQLSFTADRIVEVAQLPAAGSTAMVAAEREGTLLLTPIAPAELTAERTAAQWATPVTGHNRWMVERYGALVPADVLLPVGTAGQVALLDLLDPAKRWHRERPVLRDRFVAEEGEDEFDTYLREKAEQPAYRAPRAVERADLVTTITPDLVTVNAAAFGTAEEIARDREWTARVNQMRVIQAHAEEEFRRTEREVLSWYTQAVRKNRERLIEAALRGELLLPTYRVRPFSLDGDLGADTTIENGVRQKAGDSYGFKDRIYLDGGDCTALSTHDHWHYLCAIEPPKPAGILTLIAPTCPEALAILAGCTAEDLPPVLRHWHRYSPYGGNPILQRVDPEDWVLKNPWAQLKFRVAFGISRSAYHAGRSKLGLPRKAWPTKDELASTRAQ